MGEAGPRLSFEWLPDESRPRELVLRGVLDKVSVPAVYKALRTKILRGVSLSIDLENVERVDSAGIAMFADLLRSAKEKGCALKVSRLSKQAGHAFQVFRFKSLSEAVTRIEPPYLERKGQDLIEFLAAAKELLLLCADTFTWALTSPFVRRPYRKGAALEQAVILGSRASGIVALISFIVGLTMALLSATQLRTFGANVYVADMLALAMTRELAPLLTAILVAGRSGSAVAAEVATMKVTEEIDALRTLGLEPVRFLIVPKLYAITFTQPLLTVISAIFGILGGMLIGMLLLNLSPQTFIHQTARALILKDILSGLLKSVVFGWIILVVGAFNGFRVSGGAEGVGRVTTSAVVQAIFGVIVADAIFSLLFWYS
ncbi:MAG: MlaE family lipid ABC transporter permease subunit [Deltaproteobacteria bacterium]|nr:MlaE family lipid ABC transporter permease subunit [Deltaproteobacteria bacterium]